MPQPEGFTFECVTCAVTRTADRAYRQPETAKRSDKLCNREYTNV
jgi:hypothetical protein